MSFLRFLRANALFLSAGVLLSLTSSYGQTFFIALFAGEIMRDFDLSHGQWGLVYTVATTASAVVMIWAGALTDVVRIRHLTVGVGLLLALSCVAMAKADGLLMLAFIIFALRLTGQGMMSHLGVVAMARWFEANRGKALSVASMGFALGQAILPFVFVALLTVFAWRQLWLLSSVLVLLSIPIIFILLQAERTPQSVVENTAQAGMNNRQWTRSDMLNDRLFWALIPLLLGPPAFGTALFFHQVHLTEVKGWLLVDFVALMPVFMLVSITSTFVFGALIDRWGTGRLMQVYLLPVALSFLLIWHSETLWGAAAGLMVFGIGTGAQATVPNAFWAEFYGTRHLGSIKALAAAIMVLGSAIGPGLTAAFIDLGVTFPDQLIYIVVYFAFAAAIAVHAIGKSMTALSRSPQIDVISP